jgi:hypothetical protein
MHPRCPRSTDMLARHRIVFAVAASNALTSCATMQTAFAPARRLMYDI